MKIRVRLAGLLFRFVMLAGLLALGQAISPPQATGQEADKQELAKLEGDWVYVLQGTAANAPPTADRKIVIKGDQWTFITPRPGGGEPAVGSLKIKIDASQEPKHIDQTAATGNSRLGIYKLEGE